MTNSQFKLEDEEFALLRDFIAQYFGIYFDDNKRWLLESKLDRLMRRYSFTTFIQYYNYLVHRFYMNQSCTNPDLIDLISVVSNNETYFYREAEAFLVMNQTLLPKILKQKSSVRTLSAGCSTGEEVYTILIKLLQSGNIIQGVDVSVVGIDIDPYVLKTAKNGEYRAKAFRGITDPRVKDYMKKYFTVSANENSEECYLVKSTLKASVEFHQKNLLDKPALQELGKFDIIFCRNVLIYFNEFGKQVVIENLSEILSQNGYLFLGHSESLIGKSTAFKPVDKNRHIYYQKATPRQYRLS